MYVLSDTQALADLREPQADFAAGNTFSVEEVRAELEQRLNRAA